MQKVSATDCSNIRPVEVSHGVSVGSENTRTLAPAASVFHDKVAVVPPMFEAARPEIVQRAGVVTIAACDHILSSVPPQFARTYI